MRFIRSVALSFVLAGLLAGTTAAGEPSVSIITPAFNRVSSLAETVRSVQAQTMSDWELIIIDDASTDGTHALATSLAAADPRIKVLRLAENSGVSAARNAGLDIAKGHHIALIDSDDLWHPLKLELQLEFMAETGAGMSFTGFRKMSQDRRMVSAPYRVPRRLRYADMMLYNPVFTSSVMVTRSALAGLRFEAVRTAEDLRLWFDLLRRGVESRGLSRDLGRFRSTPGSLGKASLRSLVQRWNILRQRQGHGRLVTATTMAYWFASTSWKRVRQYRLGLPSDARAFPMPKQGTRRGRR